MLARPKRDEDKTPVMSTSLNPFDLVPKTQGFLEIVAQANWKKKKTNRNMVAMATMDDYICSYFTLDVKQSYYLVTFES